LKNELDLEIEATLMKISSGPAAEYFLISAMLSVPGPGMLKVKTDRMICLDCACNCPLSALKLRVKHVVLFEISDRPVIFDDLHTADGRLAGAGSTSAHRAGVIAVVKTYSPAATGVAKLLQR